MHRHEQSDPPLEGRIARTASFGRSMHRRYSRLFWTLHSIWALISGASCWSLPTTASAFCPGSSSSSPDMVSTLFFLASPGSGSTRVRVARGFVSYLTRVMYQETLFFLLPFYFYSTTFPSWNSAYIIVLAGLAILSCFDRMFDRLLRTSRWFAQAFFAFVTYSALQFFLRCFCT